MATAQPYRWVKVRQTGWADSDTVHRDHLERKEKEFGSAKL
jgi:hypothetical protein